MGVPVLTPHYSQTPVATATAMPAAMHTAPFPASRPPYPAIVGNTMLVVFLALASILLLLGAILVHFSPLTTNKHYATNSSDSDEAERARNQLESDTQFGKSLKQGGEILADVGIFLIVLFILLAGLLRTDISDYARFGMFFAVGLILAGLGFRL